MVYPCWKTFLLGFTRLTICSDQIVPTLVLHAKIVARIVSHMERLLVGLRWRLIARIGNHLTSLHHTNVRHLIQRQSMSGGHSCRVMEIEPTPRLIIQLDHICGLINQNLTLFEARLGEENLVDVQKGPLVVHEQIE